MSVCVCVRECVFCVCFAIMCMLDSLLVWEDSGSVCMYVCFVCFHVDANVRLSLLACEEFGSVCVCVCVRACVRARVCACGFSVFSR